MQTCDTASEAALHLFVGDKESEAGLRGRGPAAAAAASAGNALLQGMEEEQQQHCSELAGAGSARGRRWHRCCVSMNSSTGGYILLQRCGSCLQRLFQRSQRLCGAAMMAAQASRQALLGRLLQSLPCSQGEKGRHPPAAQVAGRCNIGEDGASCNTIRHFRLAVIAGRRQVGSSSLWHKGHRPRLMH